MSLLLQTLVGASNTLVVYFGLLSTESCVCMCASLTLLQVSLEMETFHLLDLARCSVGNSIQAAAFCIAAAERYSNR